MKKIISLLLVAAALFGIMCMPGEAAENVAPVVLKVNGFEEREVISVNYGFHQATDVQGQISGNPRMNTIVIRVKAASSYKQELLSWKLDLTTPRDAEIVFSNTIDGSVMKTIKLHQTYCVRYTEYWRDGEGYYEEIELLSKEYINGNVEFKRNWK